MFCAGWVNMALPFWVGWQQTEQVFCDERFTYGSSQVDFYPPCEFVQSVAENSGFPPKNGKTVNIKSVIARISEC